MKNSWNKFIVFCAMIFSIPALFGQDLTDSEGYPILYVRGEMTNSWSAHDAYKFTRTGTHYTLSVQNLNGNFKVSNADWTLNLGANEKLTTAATFETKQDGPNISADNLRNVTIEFDINIDDITDALPNTYLRISANGVTAPEVPVVPDPDPDPDPINSSISGTLPVLYINVYTDAEHTSLENEVIDRNLNHKNYFKNAEYWLDVNGCQWLIDQGAKNVGSADSPLPLEIKARGNFTRTAFAKKPFKLKLGAKQSLLGLTKSKHFALLAHADDNFGYLRNFTGFNLGRRMGLPWTPWQQPVEVIINGNYRGLYFLTESIRIEKDRINITELDDNVDTPELISGGYLIELDNYNEDNQIRMQEKSCIPGQYLDMLRITWDTPEEYSDLQQRFIRDQFTAMNDAVGDNSDALWTYMDLDDAARYYVVEEIMSHVESYHGSTYMFRDHGEGQKWHFSPLWDFGNGFNGPTNDYFYKHGPFGNTWIASMRCNGKFNDKVIETWKWFMANKFDGIYDDIDEYVAHISEAAKADRKRWKDAPTPDITGSVGTVMPVVDNTNMTERKQQAVNHLNSKVAWLRQQWGNYNGTYAEPERDTTPAAPLPAYTSSDYYTTVYFIDNDLANPWATPIYAYIWDNGTGQLQQPLGTWPGKEMTPTTIAGQDAWQLRFAPEPALTEDARIIFNDKHNQTDSYEIADGNIYFRSGEVGGVDNVTVGNDFKAEYFNLQGIRVTNPVKGQIYIVKTGDKATKQIFE